MRIFAVTSLLLLYAGSLLLAQDGFQKPVWGSERARLAFLAGKFTTETHISANPMSPNGSTGKGTSSITWAVDSMFLMLDDQSLDKLMGQYKAHGMLGYDPRDGKYILSMFNNFGEETNYRGTLSGDTLILRSKVEFPGGSFDQKLVWYKDGRNLGLKLFNDMGNGPVQFLEQIATPVTAGKK